MRNILEKIKTEKKWRSAIHGLTTKSFGILLWFIFTVLVARSLDEIKAGYFFYVLSFYLFIPPIANFGYPPLLLRYGKEMVDIGDRSGAGALLRRAIFCTIIVGLVAAFAMIALTALGLGSLYTGSVLFQLLFVASAVVFSLQALFRNAEMAFGLVETSNFNFYLLRGLLPLVTCALITFFNLMSLENFAGCLLASLILIVLLDMAALRDFLRIPPAAESSHLDVPAPWFTWVSESANALLARGDMIFVAYFLGIERAAGYFVAQRVAILATFGIDGIRSYVAPRLSEAFHARSPVPSRDKIIGEVSSIYFLSVIVCVFPLSFLSPILLSAYGISSTDIIFSCFILMFGHLLAGALGPSSFILDYAGLRSSRGIVSIITLALAPLVYGTAISSFGLIGAAIAYVMVMIGSSVVGSLLIFSKLSVWPGVKPALLAKSAVAAVASKKRGNRL